MHQARYKVFVSTPSKNITWVCANCPGHGDHVDTETPYVHAEVTGHAVKVLTVSITTYTAVRE